MSDREFRDRLLLALRVQSVELRLLRECVLHLVELVRPRVRVNGQHAAWALSETLREELEKFRRELEGQEEST
jgi:hypothetical protein